jgi:2-hydroxychromene-2-carboxylate isomerase
MTTAIRFLFDYVSPYAYLASTQIGALAERHQRQVEPVPVLFAGLLDATGTRGPAEIPAKRAYLFRDVVRLARLLGVALEPPATHPFNPLVALRVTGCVADPAARHRLVAALYRATWVERERVDQPEVVARVAEGVGLDGRALLESAASPEGKARLRHSTEEALAAGAFGVPSMLAEDELFWGLDSLPLLDRRLAGERIDPARIEGFLSVAASARRSGA